MNAHLDTHVALWMAAGKKRKLGPIRAYLRHASLFVSPIALVEMEVLREIGRIREPVNTILEVLNAEYGVEETSGDCRELGRFARSLGWTRDPFDRLIVAHALANRATLLTADDTILEKCPQAKWG